MMTMSSTATSGGWPEAVKPIGKSGEQPQAMGQALPQLHVRAQGPGVEIRWEDYNYPPVLELIHFDVTELQYKLRKVVRLLNFGFVLMSCTCLLNFTDSLMLNVVADTDKFRTRWVLQSFLQAAVLPPAAFVTFYLGYRGLAVPDPILVHRYQLAQIALGLISVLFALVPYDCVNGLLTLATDKPYSSDGQANVFWIIAIAVESFLWMLNAALALLNVVQVRRMNVIPTNVYNSPPMKMQS
eukprot:CAMPEP_0198509724 /NCGR_PEP_ID=MMETSP1462-20131121/13739_1 /TAXON_ID=1333877 /ORGANISM="Brandtodinium nutriculum, Strain RCC3387" /LENGTH=240 /DNA_ID=CAMNT_0044239035 /DNA_START=43 /DNA_END=765 /DNA_ORIENTATION=+